MRLFLVGILFCAVQCTATAATKQDKIAERASKIEAQITRRQQKKALRIEEKIAKQLKRKEAARKSRERNKEKIQDSPLKSQMDVRVTNPEFIESFKTHIDEDDILYNPNYAVFMAKSGANVKDIPIELEDATARAAGIPGIINLWDKYIDETTGQYQVPYAFEPKFEEWGRKVVRTAMDMIEEEMPCIAFIEANPRLHRDYIYFMQSRGCHSYVGRIQGAQPIYLDNACQTIGTATHEIFHALGFHHEHQRVDRDRYIRIQWENIRSTGCGAHQNVGCGIYFQKIKWTQAQASPYDYTSVMHYDGFAFSSKPGLKPTIVDKNGQVFRAQRIKASTNDMRQLCGLYSCSKCDDLPGSKPAKCETREYSTFERRLCDGFPDCVDGKDEKHCTSCNGDKSWQCQDKKQCIRTEQRCDGWSDCNDGSDERGCVDTCCKKLSLGGIVFSKLNERMNGRPVYYSTSTNKYVSFSYTDSTWNLGMKPGENRADVLAISAKICPDQIEEPWYTWNQYGGLNPCCFPTCLDDIELDKNAARPCDSDPCENGGKCTDDGYDYQCECKVGFYGAKCENVSTACSNNPCENGGKCITDGDDYTCECPLMYFGNNCEHGCMSPRDHYNVADNVSFECGNRVCTFTCSGGDTPNFTRKVVCFCSGGDCKWYPNRITYPETIQCPASTPSVFAAAAAEEQEEETTTTTTSTTTTTTTSTTTTTTTTTTPRQATKKPRPVFATKATTTRRTTTTRKTTTTTSTTTSTTTTTTTTSTTESTTEATTTRRTQPPKKNKGSGDNQCPHPTNKLDKAVRPTQECLNRQNWWKNYTCKLYCPDGKRPSVSEMKCRCRSAKQCSWWAKKVRGKVLCK